MKNLGCLAKVYHEETMQTAQQLLDLGFLHSFRLAAS